MKTLRRPTLLGATWMLALVTTTVAQTTITRVPTLGGVALHVRAINGSGMLAGFSRTALEEEHAFLYSSGVMHDLLTLGGPGSSATDLNDAGEVAGDSDTTSGLPHAFLFRNGTMTDLGTLEGGSFSFVIAINNAGHVLGQSDASDGFRGFLHRNGTLTDVGSLGSGFSTVWGLNNQGDVVGDSYTDTFEGPHAFVYRGGSMSDLGTLGGAFSTAFAINDAGVIVGESYNTNGALRAFRYSNGTMQDLGTLGGTNSMGPLKINTAGDILGVSLMPDNQTYRSFIFRNGVMTDLGTLGGNWNTANDMNNLGHVVGESETSTGTSPFIWRDGVMTDLNTLLPPDSGWLLATASHINDADQVVGVGFHNGEFAWYLLTLEGSTNQPPVANAGSDQTVECTTMTQLDGSASTDPDNDPLTFEWREGTVVLGYGATLSVNLGLGTHTLTLTVRDSNEVSSDDTLTVVVQDTTAPTVACEQTRTVAVGADCQGLVPDFASAAVAFDGCTSSGFMKSQLPAAGTAVGLGMHQVVVSVRDASGNVGTCTVLLTVVDMTPPTGECAPAMTVSTGVECHGLVPDFTGALMATDNCTPAGQLVKTQSPAAGTMMPLGSHDITLTVADAAGNKSMCVTKLHVVDHTAPVVNCPAGVTANAGAQGQAEVPDFTAGTTASDNCSDIVAKTQVPAAGTMLGLGTHNVTVTVVDAAGNPGSCTTTLTVVDVTPPMFLDISVTPNVLDNANRAMVPVTVSVRTRDNCDSAPVSRILSITSDEPVTGHADNTSPDWVVGDGLTGQVRAECVKKGDGRLYTIIVICTDASGNSSTATTTVLVPSRNGGSPQQGKVATSVANAGAKKPTTTPNSSGLTVKKSK